MAQKIVYWVTTALVALVYLAGGVGDIWQPKDVVEGATKLGYPLYFFAFLGAWKLLAVIVLLSPGLPRAKEWAYAGILINLTGASFAHFAGGDDIGKIATPLVILAIAITSWATRPEGRRLAGPWI